MRLSIRSEQMLAIEQGTQEKFVQRIAQHLLKTYPTAAVILPGGENFTVATLPPKTLSDLVRVGIARARQFQLTFESSIATFNALMFELAPNFYTHNMCQMILTDAEVEPDERVSLLLDVLSDKITISIRANYDPMAWELEPLPTADEQPVEKAAPEIKPEQTMDFDLMETVKVINFD